MQYWGDWLNIDSTCQYDLYDLMFDIPGLFSRIINTVIYADDKDDFDRNRTRANKRELAAITAAQIAAVSAAQKGASDGKNAQAKTNRYDYEIQKIKNDLMWAGIQTSDVVEVLFWQDSFDPLVSFARRTKRLTVIELLDVQYDEMRKAGFSYDFIATKTYSMLKRWAEKLLSPDAAEYERGQATPVIDDEYDTDIASDLFSMFFADDDNDTEESEM